MDLATGRVISQKSVILCVMTRIVIDQVELSLKQGENEDLLDYLGHFKSEWNVMMSLFGKNMLDGLVKNTPEYTALTIGNTIGKTRVEKKGMDNFMAMLFLRNVDQVRFGEMLVDFRKSYTNKDNRYPQSVADMMDVMCQQPEKRNK